MLNVLAIRSEYRIAPPHSSGAPSILRAIFGHRVYERASYTDSMKI